MRHAEILDLRGGKDVLPDPTGGYWPPALELGKKFLKKHDRSYELEGEGTTVIVATFTDSGAAKKAQKAARRIVRDAIKSFADGDRELYCDRWLTQNPKATGVPVEVVDATLFLTYPAPMHGVEAIIEELAAHGADVQSISSAGGGLHIDVERTRSRPQYWAHLCRRPASLVGWRVAPLRDLLTCKESFPQDGGLERVLPGCFWAADAKDLAWGRSIGATTLTLRSAGGKKAAHFLISHLSTLVHGLTDKKGADRIAAITVSRPDEAVVTP